ncbi:MAG TPA: hypothetical protein VNA24_23555 [Hyalangium sp.]|nr:hypothetical protein [Hyalangium sp.]
MSVLVEEARAPGVTRAEIDALLVGLSQPLSSDTSPRERADLLLSLMEDGRIADYTGADGRTVRVAAIQALLALGYPYALEVPPEALEAKARDEGNGARLLSTRKGKVGFGLVTLAGLAQLIPVIAVAATQSWSSWSSLGLTMSLAIAFIVCTTLLPALVTMAGHNLGNGGIKMTGSVWLFIVSLLWIIPSLLGFAAFPLNLIPLAMGGMILAGSMLMHSKD